MLKTVVHGNDTERPPLLIAHGLFGSARNWGAVARRLSDRRKVIAVDMRNHAESQWFQTHGYEEMAEDLGQVIAHEGGRMDVLGHSMGGKAAMVLAVTRSELVNRLIIADISPVAYSHTQAHLIAEMQDLPLEGIGSRADADRALASRIDSAQLRAFLLQSLDLKEKKWRLNLDVLAAEMPRIMGFPHLEGHHDGPVLFLSGAESDYVRREHRAEIKRLFPAARFARIPGAGHWLHAEKPREFVAAVQTFLDA